MTAFCGIFQRSNHTMSLEKMVTSMAFRGPDGIDRAEQAGFSGASFHNYTIETTRNHQPMAFTQGRYTIVADARLKGLRDTSESDAATILHMYHRYGADCVNHLRGAFAFAIWDGQKLFCARDRVGKRPFYYALTADAFVCATLIEPILVTHIVPRRPNEYRIRDMFTLTLDADAISTMYEGIVKLPPAHTLTVTAQTSHLANYWSLDAFAPDKTISDDDASAALKESFITSVYFHIEGIEKLGSQVSGGIDSSSVAMVATQARSEPIHTYTALMAPNTPGDERAYIDDVLAFGNFIPHFFDASQRDPLEDMELWWPYLEEPLINPNTFTNRRTLLLGQANGVGGILTGQDGDSVLSHGFGRMVELARTHQWEAFEHEAKELQGNVSNFFADIQARILNYGGIAVEGFLREGRFAQASRAAQQLARITETSTLNILLNKSIKRIVRDALYAAKLRKPQMPVGSIQPNPDFAKRVGYMEQYIIYHKKPNALTERHQHHQKMMTAGHTQVMETEDRYLSAYGVQLRYPFYDADLMALSLSLPAHMKLHNGLGRYIFRQAMEGILPPSVQWRSDKAHLGYNFRDIFLKHHGEALQELVNDPSQTVYTYVDQAALQDSLTHINKHYSNKSLMGLWQALLLNRWLKQNV